MACHDRGRGLAERAGLHVMGKVGDDGAIHLEVDLDGRPAQLGMRGGTGIRCVKPSQPGDVAGQFDDALVVDVVQHGINGLRRAGQAPLASAPLSPIYGWQWWKKSPATDSAARNRTKPAVGVLLSCYSGVRRQAAPSAGDTPALKAGRTESTWTL